jgi:hypothetical protein
MEVLDKGREALSDALWENEFRAIDEFDAFVTYARAGDPLKIHVGPDGSFAAFDGDNQLLTEGEGPGDLYRLLVTKPPQANQRRRQYSHRGVFRS